MRQGRSNELGFAGGIGGGQEVMFRFAKELLDIILILTDCGSGRLPPICYLKMHVFCLAGGDRPPFRQVVSGVEYDAEPYVFHSVGISRCRDIVRSLVGVARSGKPHLPVPRF